MLNPKVWFVLSTALPVALTSRLLAQAPGPHAALPDYTYITDPARGGPDYAVQGEYAGQLAGGARLAAQVVARGQSKFNVFFLHGGLPGDGWDGQKAVRTVAAYPKPAPDQGPPDQSAPPALQLVPVGGASAADLPQNKWRATLAGGAITGQTPEGEGFALLKQQRQSPTLGAAPPAGAVVLFDGSNAAQWVHATEAKPGSPLLLPGNLLSNGVRSKRNFGDCKLHLEFRLPLVAGALGQARGNSGVVLQDLYEIQLLDSFGQPATDADCGALFGQAAPRVNMCFPPLAWQTYDIDFRAARLGAGGKVLSDAVASLTHNGVLVLDHVHAKPTTTRKRSPQGVEQGPLYLQWHGSPLAFRNIWLVPL